MFAPKTIGIIGGRGKMGSYFATIFKSLGYKVLISGRKTRLTNKLLAAKSDVVIVSVPIDKTCEVIREISLFVKEKSLITDFTSIKTKPVKEMLKSKANVIGCHPLFGPTNTIENQIVILTPARAKKDYLQWLKSFFEDRKAIVKIMSAKKHDKLMGITQGLSHFHDISFGLTIKKLGIPIKDILEIHSPSYLLKLNLVGRIFAQEASLYGNIQFQNSINQKILKKYISSCKKLIKIDKEKRLDKFEKIWKEVAGYFGKYCSKAMDETNWIIEVLNRNKEIKQKNKIQKQHRCTNAPKPHHYTAVLGPKNTYSDLAAQKYAPLSSRFFCKTITEAFEALKKGKASQIIVPAENRLSGTIWETLDNLFHSKLKIKEKIVMPIKHSLVSLSPIPLKKIRTILSSPQPLSQCSRFLKKNLPHAELISVSSTADAMHKIIADHLSSAAAIGDSSAAINLGLAILKKNIEDTKDNETSFLVIANTDMRRRHAPQTCAAKSAWTTSIAFHFSADAPGSLFSVLKIFAEDKINLTKIESRPAAKKFGDYIFFLDFEGSIADTAVKNAVKKTSRLVSCIKVFGSYFKNYLT